MLPPWRGGTGEQRSQLVLAPGEEVVGAVVRAGAYVDGLILTTSKGRTVVLGGNGGSPYVASPCPQGAYRLAEVRGFTGDYLEKVRQSCKQGVEFLIPGK